MLGERCELDHQHIEILDFLLAEALGKFLWEIDAMPNEERIRWHSFYLFRREMENHQAEVSKWRKT